MKFKSPVVVGYKGEIGKFILAGLLDVMPKALDIWCFDQFESEKQKIDRIQKADYIFLCVPLDETGTWLMRYKKYLKDKIIIEQCSRKGFLYKDKRFKKFNFLSMHILFRPSITPNADDRRVALIEDERWSGLISDIGKITKSYMIWYKDYKEHDRDMAINQGVVHRVLLSIGKMLDNTKSLTYVSGRLIKLRNRILAGNPELYKAIQENENVASEVKRFKSMFGDFDVKEFFGT